MLDALVLPVLGQVGLADIGCLASSPSAACIGPGLLVSSVAPLFRSIAIKGTINAGHQECFCRLCFCRLLCRPAPQRLVNKYIVDHCRSSWHAMRGGQSSFLHGAWCKHGFRLRRYVLRTERASKPFRMYCRFMSTSPQNRT